MGLLRLLLRGAELRPVCACRAGSDDLLLQQVVDEVTELAELLDRAATPVPVVRGQVCHLAGGGCGTALNTGECIGHGGQRTLTVLHRSISLDRRAASPHHPGGIPPTHPAPHRAGGSSRRPATVAEMTRQKG